MPLSSTSSHVISICKQKAPMATPLTVLSSRLLKCCSGSDCFLLTFKSTRIGSVTASSAQWSRCGPVVKVWPSGQGVAQWSRRGPVVKVWPSGQGVRLESGRPGVRFPLAPGFIPGGVMPVTYKNGTPVATLPGAWGYTVCVALVGLASVYCDWVRARLISNFLSDQSCSSAVSAETSLR